MLSARAFCEYIYSIYMKNASKASVILKNISNKISIYFLTVTLKSQILTNTQPIFKQFFASYSMIKKYKRVSLPSFMSIFWPLSEVGILRVLTPEREIQIQNSEYEADKYFKWVWW